MLKAMFKGIKNQVKIGFQSYKPIEKLFLILTVVIFILLFAGFILNKEGPHYLLTINAVRFFSLIYCFILFQLGCMLRKDNVKLASFVTALGIIGILVCSTLILSMDLFYTPEKMITQSLASFNGFIHFNQQELINWTYSHHWLYKVLWSVYWSLVYAFVFLAFLFFLRDHHELLLCSTAVMLAMIIGFTIFYIWPALPPQFVWENIPKRAEDTLAIKAFYDARHFIPINFSAAAIVFPSFHVIYSLLIAISLRHYKVLFVLGIIYFVLITASTLMLGWHFAADVIAGVIIASFSYFVVIYLDKKFKRKK